MSRRPSLRVVVGVAVGVLVGFLPTILPAVGLGSPPQSPPVGTASPTVCGNPAGPSSYANAVPLPPSTPATGLIAFAATCHGTGQIFVVPPNGVGARELTTDGGDEPAWSRDGTKLAFVRGAWPNGNVFTMNADGSHQTRLTNNSANEHSPSWSPDGSQLVFSSDRDGPNNLYIMNSDGSAVRRLTSNAQTGFFEGDSAPQWSPKGDKIVFMRGVPSEASGGFAIFTVTPDGATTSRLTEPTTPTGRAINPRWSPDASKIAFVSGYPCSGGHRLWVMDADGGNVVDVGASLTEDSCLPNHPSFSPDGTRLVFSLFIRCGSLAPCTNPLPPSGIYSMNLDGTGFGTVAPAADSPDWQPASPTVTPPPPLPTPPGSFKGGTLPANLSPPGLDTGMTLSPGDLVSITAVGSAGYGYEGAAGCVGYPTTDPDGHRSVNGAECGPKADATALLATEPIGTMLYGMQCPSGGITWRRAGTRTTFTWDGCANAQLRLVYNEVYYADNTGEYSWIATKTAKAPIIPPPIASFLSAVLPAPIVSIIGSILPDLLPTTTTTATSTTSTTVAPPPPSPPPVDRYGITSYDRMTGGAPHFGNFDYAYQAFTAASDTITNLGVTVGNPTLPGGATVIPTVMIRLCTSSDCSHILAEVHPRIVNYGNSSADIGDVAVERGSVYYVVWYQPVVTNGETWVTYWWGTGSTIAQSDRMQAIVRGYDKSPFGPNADTVSVSLVAGPPGTIVGMSGLCLGSQTVRVQAEFGYPGGERGVTLGELERDASRTFRGNITVPLDSPSGEATISALCWYNTGGVETVALTGGVRFTVQTDSPPPLASNYKIVTNPPCANVRSGPGTTYQAVACLTNGTPIAIECQIRGGPAYTDNGRMSNIWDRLSSGSPSPIGGNYVSDVLTDTPAFNDFSPGLTMCGGVVGPPIPPNAHDCESFVADVTIPDGTKINKGATFTKTWRLLNCGNTDWSDLTAVRIGGTFGPERFEVQKTTPGATADVSVTMTAPNTTGIARVTYALFGPRGRVPIRTGQPGSFYAEINVVNSGAPPTTAPRPTGPKPVYLALGDSFSSGEGARATNGPAYIAGTDTSSNQCHRSLNAYPSRLSGGRNIPPIFSFHACSGAVVDDFYSKNQNNPSEVRQIDWIHLANPSMITLTIGGNDIHFREIMSYCASRYTFQETCQSKWDGAVSAAIASLASGFADPRSLRSLYRDIRDAGAPGIRILVAGYPRPFPERPPNTCSTGVPPRVFERSDMEWLNRKVADLDAAIASAVQDVPGLTYVDVLDAFKGQEFCTSHPMFNGPRLPLVESYHPNSEGQAAYAKAFRAKLNSLSRWGRSPFLEKGE